MDDLTKVDAFAAVDVETANFDQGSICSIGIAVYRSGELAHSWYSLVNPDCEFDRGNIAIHGIRPKDVANAPRIKDVAKVIWRALDGAIVVSHTAFDKIAFKKASQKYRIKNPRSIWLDSSMVARRTWPQFSKRGYGLKSVCDFIGHKFDHHNALADAIACGKIITHAMTQTRSPLSEILDRCYNGNWKADFHGLPISREPTNDGPLSTETTVITGELKIGRSRAAQLLASLGSRVTDSVTRKTTILIVGTQAGATAGYASEKLKNALNLQENGHPIKIVGEAELISIFNKYKILI
jgi:DNA polymerase III subunit epsilon